MEVVPVTNKILRLHFDEGYANYGRDLASTVLFRYELDVDAAQTKANYLISSSDDPNFSTAQNPIGSVGRKSKGTDFGDLYKSPPYILGHWIYLELPFAMQEGKSYTVSLNNIAVGNLDNITFTFDSYKTRSSSVHVSQIGFPTNAPKYAYLSHWMGDAGAVSLDDYSGSAFHVVNTSTGLSAYSGTIAKRKSLADGSPQTNTFSDGDMTFFGNEPVTRNFTEADVWECNFSAFSSSGEYKIVVEGMGSSLPFRIADDVYREVYRTASKGLFWQRSGIEMEIEPGLMYPRSHHPANPNVNTYYQSDWKWYDDPDHNRPITSTTQLDVWGWYKDAGDWDGYPRHVYVPYSLLLLYDLAPEKFGDSDVGNKYIDNETNVLYNEGTNGIPDLLDEAMWLIKYYKRAKDLGLAAGLTTGGVPGSYAGVDGVGNNQASWQDTRDLKLSAEDPTATFNYAATAAWLASCLDKAAGGTHSESAGWITEAQAAYSWALNNSVATDENVKEFRSARMLASLALYRYTQQKSYHDQFVADLNDDAQYAIAENNWLGANPWELSAGIYSFLPSSFPNLDPSLQNEIKTKIIGVADTEFLQPAQQRGYRMGWDWNKAGINGATTTPIMYPLAIAYEITNNKVYWDAINTTASYFMGGNPMDKVLMTGLGHHSISAVFHPDSWTLFDNDSKIVNLKALPGLTTYNSVLQDLSEASKLTDLLWSGNEAFSAYTAYPFSPKDTWPISEIRFENRESIVGSEFTVNENNAPLIFAYGYLAGDNNTFTVNTPPTVAITSPSSDEVLNDGVSTTFSVSTSDDERIHHVEYYMDWHRIGASYEAPFSITLDEFAKSFGDVEITVLAVDNRGAKTLSTPITIVHNNALGTLPFGGEAAILPGVIQVEHFDVGANGESYVDNTPGNTTPAEYPPVNYRPGTDVDIAELWDEELGANHLMVMSPQNGEWLEYTVDISETVLYDISLRILNGISSNRMSVILDETDTVVNQAPMPVSGWWPLRERSLARCLELPEGLHTLRFVFDKVDDYVKINDIRVTKSQRVTGISIDQDQSVQAQVGKTTQMTATLTPSDASCPEVNWYSSNESVATIDADGVLTGVGVGTTTITVESQDLGFQNSITVTVTPSLTITSPAAGLTVTPGSSATVTVTGGSGGTITQVDFFLNGSYLYTDDTSPYSQPISIPAGTHQLETRATYSEGYVSKDQIQVYGRDPYTADFSPHAIPGRIQFEDYDHGGNGESYYDLTEGNASETYRNDDVEIEGDARVTGLDNGEWLEYTVDVLQSTNYNLTVTYTSTGAVMEILVDGSLVKTLTMDNIGFWPPKDKVFTSVPLTAGEHVIRVRKTSGILVLDRMEWRRDGVFPITGFNAEINGFASDQVSGVPGDYHVVNHNPVPFDAVVDSVTRAYPSDAWQVVTEPDPTNSIAFTAEEFQVDKSTYIIYTGYSGGNAFTDTIFFIKTGTYDFEGSELVETTPLTDKIALLRFDDGKVTLHAKDEAKVDEIETRTFDVYSTNIPVQTSSYVITSSDDPNYSSPQNPTAVYRKSKPTEQGENPSQFILDHWLYLELPFAMQRGSTYSIAMAEGIANNGNTTSLTFDEFEQRSEAIHVNQVGYVPSAGLKYGYIAEWMGDGGGLELADYGGNAFHIVDASTLSPAFSGTIQKRRALTDSQVDNSNMSLFGPSNNYYGSDVYEADFSSFSGVGEFYLVVEGFGRSFKFEMAEDIYDTPFEMTTKFLYNQRAGIAKEAAYTPFHTTRDHHPDDIQIVKISTRSIDEGDIQRVANNLEVGAHYTWGWYHDAGDWDGYMPHMLVPVSLLSTYEAGPLGFTDGQLNIPESGNGLPDILDEAAWLISYFRRNINPDGSVFGARVTADYTGQSKLPTGHSGQDTRKWHLFAADPHTNFAFAALAANYAYNLEIAGVSDSTTTLLSEALAAYNWAKNPDNQLAGDADKGIDHLGKKLADLELFAAASLYKLTGDAQYQTDFENALVISSATDDLMNSANNQQWGVWTYVTSPDHANVNASLKATLKQATINWGVKRIVDNAKQRSGRQGSEFSMPPIIGSETTPRVFEAIFAHRVANEGAQKDEILSYIYTTTDYFLGNNPLNMAWISGLGERHPVQALHLDSWYNDAGIRGGIVDGIVPYGIVWHGIFDPENCHCKDDEDIIQAAWTNDADWGKLQSYPDRFSWPISETWFDTRYSVLDGEFTVYQTTAYASGAYGFLVALGNELPTENVVVTGISLDQATVSLDTGENVTLVATIAPVDATNKAVTWMSSNENVATVSNGQVTAIAEGVTTITVTTVDSGLTATSEVTVTASAVAVAAVTLDQASLTLDEGESATLVATVTPTDASNQSVVWESSDESIATVINGVVTAVSAGTATVIVTTDEGGFTATSTVIVQTGTATPGTFQQDSGADGVVSMEAENFSSKSIGTGTFEGMDWTEYSDGDASGGAYMMVPNDNDKNGSTSTNAPLLTFDVDFVKTGTHYLWARQKSPNGNDNSISPRIGSTLISQWHMTENQTSWVWSKLNVSFTVATTGVQSLNVYMREDGTPIDKFLITTNSSYKPSDAGARTADQHTSSVSDAKATIGDQNTSPVNFSVYPNPTNGKMLLSLAGTDQVEVSVYSLSGIRVFYKEEVSESLDIHLPAGLYVLTLKSSEMTKSTKIIFH